MARSWLLSLCISAVLSQNAPGLSSNQTAVSVLEYICDLVVRTGNATDAGTDANVYAVFHGSTTRSDKVDLDNIGENNFRPGRTDVFRVTLSSEVFPLSKVVFSRNNVGSSPNWLLDSVDIYCPKPRVCAHFYANQWLTSKTSEISLTEDFKSILDNGIKNVESKNLTSKSTTDGITKDFKSILDNGIKNVESKNSTSKSTTDGITKDDQNATSTAG